MLRNALSIAAFSAWWIVLAFGLKAITLDVDEFPVDYRTYAAAADLFRETGSPYPGAESAQEVWKTMHRSALAVFRPEEANDDAPEVVSGPYLYPPSLALALQQIDLSAGLYLIILTGATIALCLGWRRLSGDRSLLWLLPMVSSIDLIAIFLGGNIEILLIALSLLACRLLWRHHPLGAAPLMAAVVLVKPQFGLLFLAFACLWACTANPVRPFRRTGFMTVSAVSLLIFLEVLRWPEAARADFLAYMANPAEFQYFSLPRDAQWPMDMWNRAPLQVLLNLGLSFGVAEAFSIALYVLLLVASVVLLRGKHLTFATVFALAYTLLLVGRPITWSMPMLAIFALIAVWPELSRTERITVALVAAGAGASHWAAFALFTMGIWPGLLTLQTPGVPWETLVILPGAWALIVLGARRRPAMRTHD